MPICPECKKKVPFLVLAKFGEPNKCYECAMKAIMGDTNGKSS